MDTTDAEVIRLSEADTSHGPRVVVLAGGTGGAKLARGLLDVAGSRLTVIANVADDISVYGAHVSPDPDLCCYWLADMIDSRGWGIADDSFTVMNELRARGEEIWFNLGDRDLAVCLQRAAWLADGVPLTTCLQRLRASLGIAAQVLPPTDDPLRTEVRVGGAWYGIQQYLIRLGASGPIEELRVDGIADAKPTMQALHAIADADVIVVGPSNPAISIEPILAVEGMREAIALSKAAVVAVSPLVGGVVLKGPTANFLDYLGVTTDTAGVAGLYQGIIDGFVSDEYPGSEFPSDIAHLCVDVQLDTPETRRELATRVLGFASSLERQRPVAPETA